MNSKRLYFGLLGLICLLLVVLVAGVYGANGLLGSRAVTLTSLKAKSQALTQEQQGLNDAKKDIQKYASLEKIAETVVPQDKDQAEAVREIVNIAGANGMALGSITFPASTLGAGVSPATDGIAPASTAAPVSSTASNAKNSLSQLLPVKGIPGVYQLNITITSDPNRPVQYNQIINFLSGLERDRRTAQVTSISLEPAQSNQNYLTFTIILNEYIKP